MICRTYTALPLCLLLAICLAQFGSAVQWHELEHLGEHLAQVDGLQGDQDESDDGLHGLCKVCLSLKSLVLADTSVFVDIDSAVHSVPRLTTTADTPFIPDWPPVARGPPHSIL